MIRTKTGRASSRAARKPTISEIMGVFARYGNLTLGGGSATIGVLQQQIETKRGWINSDQFRLCYGLSRVTPGTNLLAFCTAVGWLVRGWVGACVALLAASLPCSIMAVAVTAAFEIWTRNPWMKISLHGALAAAVGIIFYTCWHLTRMNLRRSNWVRVALLFGGSVALEILFGLPPIRILLIAALVGAILPKEANT